MSLFADFFSLRRRDSNPLAKASADGKIRQRRRSLSAKYQTFFSNISQDFKSTDGSGNQKAANPVTQAPAVKLLVAETVTPVTIIEPQESHKPAENPETPEKLRLRRRPKTPVRRIGELEGYREQPVNECHIGSTVDFAAARDSQADLVWPTTPRSLRKIGGHYDLRRSSIDSDDMPRSPNFSDVDTVVGTESPGTSTRKRNDSRTSYRSSGSFSTSSYYSATSEKDFAFHEIKDVNPPKKTTSWNQDICTKPLDFAHNIEMQICLDLLKQDLSSSMSPKNPSDSTLALQIWLMIESYESLKQRLQQQLLQQTGLGSKKTSEFTFQALDHWLEALYSVYNLQLQDRRSHVTL